MYTTGLGRKTALEQIEQCFYIFCLLKTALVRTLITLFQCTYPKIPLSPRETTPPRPTKLPAPLPLASGQSRKGEERFAFSFPGSGPRPVKESALDSQKAQQATAVNFT